MGKAPKGRGISPLNFTILTYHTMSEKATEKTEFLSLQDELNQVEKSFNSVEKTEIQQERISKKLDTIMQKINELTTNKEQALQKKELVELN
jgi:hypothetical protein